jgi:membrane protease YdiL (CAAX protease family)
MQSVLTFLLFVPFLALVAVANLAEQRPWARYVTFGSLVAINLGLLGLAGLTLLNAAILGWKPELLPAQSRGIHWLTVSAICAGTALLACAPLLSPVRRGISRVLPIDATSTVHATALAFAVYELGLGLGQMALLGDMTILAEAGLSLTIWDVLLSGLPLLLLALLGVGWLLRRTGRQVLERLGLRLPTWRHVLLAVGITALLLALDYGLNMAWQAVDAAGYEQFQQMTDQLYGGLITVGGAVVLGLSAGISEEMLFRGAIQPRLGLLLAAILFALGHTQYGLTVATLEVFVIGLVLGLVRNRTNLTTCILIHAGFNATGVLLGLLKP